MPSPAVFDADGSSATDLPHSPTIIADAASPEVARTKSRRLNGTERVGDFMDEFEFYRLRQAAQARG